MAKFTVVGLYGDTGQRYCEWVEADGPDTAEELVKDRVERDTGGDWLNVAGVFAGQLTALDKDPSA